MELAILIPTFERPRELERLLRVLAADPEVVGHRLPVLVSDNASADRTAELVRGLVEELPQLDLRLHVQPSNVGALANMRWLIEHAPPADYLWVVADDDYPVAGTVAAVLEAIAAEGPELIHVPARWELADGGLHAVSPCPPEVQAFSSARELLLTDYYLHFISGNVVRRPALLEALSLVRTRNEWSPHIWFGVAGRGGRCLVLPFIGIVAGVEVTWRDRVGPVVTNDVVGAYDDGFHLVVDEDEFVVMLDARYPAGGPCDEYWMAAPIEDLCSAVRRFPASRQLRRLLTTRAFGAHDRDALTLAAKAARASGAAAEGERLVAEAESLYLDGHVYGALQCLESALECDPTSADGWCNLGVVRHALMRLDAADALERALTVDPGHIDASRSLAVLSGRG